MKRLNAFCYDLYNRFRCILGLELCDPSLRLLATMMSGLTTFAGELLLLAVALGCGSWRGLLGTGAAPLTLFLCYGLVYEENNLRISFCDKQMVHSTCCIVLYELHSY